MVANNKKPNLKDHPSGYVKCNNGFWTYSRRAARNGREGWMFHEDKKK